MRLDAFLAIAAAKFSRFAINLLGRGGTAMPGKIALKICPNLLEYLARDVQTIVVTGTNGKTTTSRMIEKALKDMGVSYIANRSGANLHSGIVTEFALNSTLGGKVKADYAVIECDEAAARHSFPQLNPKVVVVTNLFRDQLDRFGEVTTTLSLIQEAISKISDARICLNADCSLTASLAEMLPNTAFFFGIDASTGIRSTPASGSDAPRCIKCKTPYEYDYTTFAHLGGFRCPECGYARRDCDVAVTKVCESTLEGTSVMFRINGEETEAKINLPAAYNIYNAAAAVTALTVLDMPREAIFSGLATFSCGFGRMENFSLGKVGAKMMLVKNPAGCNQVIDFLSLVPYEYDLVVLLNDREGDGTDVSWIWECDFEKLTARAQLYSVTVSGIRANDMYLRFKYAGIDENNISIEPNYTLLAQKVNEMERPCFIIPTYTAMLGFRSELVKLSGGADFWEEQ